MATRGEDVVGVLSLFLVQLAEHSLSQDFREADHRVQRRSELVGHVGEEFRLVPVGRLDLAAFVFDLTKKPGVLDGKSQLGGKSLKKIHHFRLKFTGASSPDR